MTGSLTIVGLGPGSAALMAPAAAQALAAATDLVGYGPYLDRVPATAEQRRHASDNRVELQRAREALTLAASGHRVAVVSGGDPGIFAMAAAVLEAVEAGDPAWRALAIDVVPGISAMQAASAQVGALLGHDFCAISLSDNLKPRDVIARRLSAALQADFVIALYNPISKARPDGLGAALDLARGVQAATTPVVFARAVSRADETIRITTLAEAEATMADMQTVVIIGSSQTRLVAKAGGGAWVLTPRSYEAAS
ncbi:MAG: precorrin-3B C(17)-methyltransferase [Hyphomicrobiaceae bacterium]|nr:precorrin-3B C(17)-methyltransferase [Hyphomicrobiaceae bacterium]